MLLKKISIRGAREHNLKSVNLDLPRDQLTVITGLSGSGKSSLAFDTIYAEGQRRYVESLSAYARQFLELMQKPDLDSIEGLSPSISIEQKTTSKNPRSTVGTVTEIYDYLRLLFARVGVPHSPSTGLPIESQSISQMVDRIRAMESGSRLYILAPIVRGRKGEYKKEIQDLGQRGFQRIRIDGELYDIEEAPALDKKYKHDIEVLIDRVIVKDGIEERLADSLETALNLSDGIVYIDNADQPPETTKHNTKGGIKNYAPSDRIVFSERFACPVSGFTIDEIEPRLFSFNNPFGACRSCDGLGTEMFFDKALIIPNTALSLKKGAIAPWADSSSKYYQQTLKSLAEHYNISLAQPWSDLSKNFRQTILFGSENENISMNYNDGNRSYNITKPFEGVIPNMKRRWRETDSNWIRDELTKYQTITKCSGCNGFRLKEEALCVKVNGLHIGQIVDMSIEDSKQWFNKLNSVFSKKNQQIASRILKEINERLTFLSNVGLDYLTLSRSSSTLSGGESQRIRLASQIGSGLTGVLYVLDEPSIGLHQRDNNRLLQTLKRLRDLGNTVIVVEHDEEAIRAADHLIDVGPGAGIHGGEIIAQGTPIEVMGVPESLTGQYLIGDRKIEVPKSRRPFKNGYALTITGAKANNLQSITASFPLGLFTCVTGVSGGGKSSLVIETLYKILARKLNNARTLPGEYNTIEGIELVDKIVDINQSPIGRTPRSNPATYTGAFTPIRDWFSALPEAKIRGYKAGRFSFNVKGGRCEVCQGDGVIKIEMHFLPDVYVQCESCKGKRYNRETMEIRFRNKSIAEVLNMTVEEAADFFKAIPSIRDKLETLKRVGLGYIHLGQQATTLSGGEAQRIKLSKELSKKATGKTVYILDEPTTGLHFEDIKKLLEVLHALVKQGNTVIVIEHNLEIIKTADWIIDIGPDGGIKGGEIIAKGTPEQLSKSDSYTGEYLRPYLTNKNSRPTF